MKEYVKIRKARNERKVKTNKYKLVKNMNLNYIIENHCY